MQVSEGGLRWSAPASDRRRVRHSERFGLRGLTRACRDERPARAGERPDSATCVEARRLNAALSFSNAGGRGQSGDASVPSHLGPEGRPGDQVRSTSSCRGREATGEDGAVGAVTSPGSDPGICGTASTPAWLCLARPGEPSSLRDLRTRCPSLSRGPPHGLMRRVGARHRRERPSFR